MWLSNQPNKAELCKKNDIAKVAYPDTCNNKCNGQHFIKCINVRVPIHNPTHNPTLNSSNDYATESPFMYKNKDNE